MLVSIYLSCTVISKQWKHLSSAKNTSLNTIHGIQMYIVLSHLAYFQDKTSLYSSHLQYQQGANQYYFSINIRYFCAVNNRSPAQDIFKLQYFLRSLRWLMLNLHVKVHTNCVWKTVIMICMYLDMYEVLYTVKVSYFSVLFSVFSLFHLKKRKI